MRSEKNHSQHQTSRRRSAQARWDSLAGTIRPSPSGVVPVLECGHPGLPGNLNNGSCGTCQYAYEFRRLSKTIIDPDLKARMAEFAARFRSGAILYDTGGKNPRIAMSETSLTAACAQHQ